MTVQRSAISGIAFPGDMDALHRIYDSLRNERGFCHGSPAAQDLARATMSLFSQGVSDESEIRESIAIYLGRKSPAATLGDSDGFVQAGNVAARGYEFPVSCMHRGVKALPMTLPNTAKAQSQAKCIAVKAEASTAWEAARVASQAMISFLPKVRVQALGCSLALRLNDRAERMPGGQLSVCR